VVSYCCVFDVLRVTELAAENKMSVANLASIFGPIMMNVDKVSVSIVYLISLPQHGSIGTVPDWSCKFSFVFSIACAIATVGFLKLSFYLYKLYVWDIFVYWIFCVIAQLHGIILSFLVHSYAARKYFVTCFQRCIKYSNPQVQVQIRVLSL